METFFFHAWKALLVTRHIRWRISRGENIPSGHRGWKKKDDDDDDDDGGNKNSAQEGWEGSLNQAVKSFPPGKGRIKVESDLPLPSSLLREAVTTRKRSRIPVEK